MSSVCHDRHSSIGERAARRKPAAAGHVDQRRRRACDRAQVARLCVDVGQRAHERDRVGMARVREQGLGVGQLDDLAGVHDGDAVAHLADHAQVVADEDHAHPEIALELEQEAQDLILDEDVQRRRRLVGQQHLRPRRDRHSDQDALAHAAAELVRVVAHPPLGDRDADPLEQLDRAPVAIPPGDVLVRADGLLDLVADPHHRVERAHRVLEDHRQVGAAQPLQLPRPEVEQVALAVPTEPHRAGGAGRRRGHQARDRAAGDALAAAALADEAEDLALAQGEGHAVDGAHDTRIGGDERVQVGDLQHGLRGGVSHLGGGCRPVRRRSG